MKIPRRRYWLPLAILTALVAAARFDVHYHIIGWWRGDAYFRGLPASYWRDDATAQVLGAPRWVSAIKKLLRIPSEVEGRSTSLFTSDPESAKVVAQLLRDEYTDRRIKEQLLKNLETWSVAPPNELLAVVHDHLTHRNEGSRFLSARLLWKWNHHSAAGERTLIALLEKWAQDVSPFARANTARYIARLAAERPEADLTSLIAILTALEGDTTNFVRETAEEAHENIRALAKRVD